MTWRKRVIHMTPHTFFIRNLTKINFFNLRKPKIDFKSFREVEMRSWMASRQHLLTNIFNLHVCVSQKTQPWPCASEKKISPVKINRCVEMAKIEISVIRIILGWFGSKISSKNLTFSYWKLKSLRCPFSPYKLSRVGTLTVLTTCVENYDFLNSVRAKNHFRVEISKKKFHPYFDHNEGFFLKLKNPKNQASKIGFHSNSICEFHHFVVMFILHSYIHSLRQTNGPKVTNYFQKIMNFENPRPSPSQK